MSSLFVFLTNVPWCIMSKIQLVHESALTTQIYMQNRSRGISTVVLVPVETKEEASLRLRKIADRIRQKLPTADPELSAYCCGTKQLRGCRRLYRALTSVFNDASPKAPRVIEHHQEWQA